MLVKLAVMNTGVAATQPAENPQNIPAANSVDSKVQQIAKETIPNTTTEAQNKDLKSKGCWKKFVEFLEKIFCCICRALKKKDPKKDEVKKDEPKKDATTNNATAVEQKPADQAAAQNPAQVTQEGQPNGIETQDPSKQAPPLPSRDLEPKSKTSETETSAQSDKPAEPPTPPVPPTFDGQPLPPPPPPPPLLSLAPTKPLPAVPTKAVNLRPASKTMKERLKEQAEKAGAEPQKAQEIQASIEEKIQLSMKELRPKEEE